MRKLEREGFRFVNWIQAGVDENGQQVWEDYEKHGCAVMKKSKSGRHDYREVEPDGSVN